MARLLTKPQANGTAHHESEDIGTGVVSIKPLEERTVAFRITGTTPYLQLKFSEKAINQMASKMSAPSKAKMKVRDARDFDADYKAAQHISADGWNGIPAAAVKAAMVSACKITGLPMTRAKILFHVEADGFDATSGDGLIKIAGKPVKHIGPVRNATGVADLRVRAQWLEWSATVRVRFDASNIDAVNILNILYRAGKQIGIGEGRPDSKKSCGMGFGLFDVEVA